jgi:hypothetical protein
MFKLIIYISLFISDNEKKKIENVLDNLHIYASKANAIKYFELFDSEAVFFGTDASERWHINEFKDYTIKRFESGSGWTYVPISRNIYINDNTAWFDEELSNEKYGIFRGTGVLIKKNDKWLITQYNLLLPIPNDLLKEYSREIIKFLNKNN